MYLAQSARLYSTIVALAGFLFFVCQPLVQKQLLPVVGGAPMLSLISLFFFQLALVLGYGYVVLIRRLSSAKKQRVAHLGLLLVTLLLLPQWFSFDLTSFEPNAPLLWLAIALGSHVLLPVVLLAASSPLLQAWWADSGERNPYSLYSISNLACIAALVGFLFLFEPLFNTQMMVWLWMAGFAAVFVLFLGFKPQEKALPQTPTHESDNVFTPSATMTAKWLVISFLANSLLYGLTFYLNHKIIAAPMVWLIPLTGFLLSFYFAFKGHVKPKWLSGWGLLIVPLSIMLMSVMLDSHITALIHLLAFQIACLGLAYTLSQLKPHPRLLPKYYFYLSLGGLVAGVYHLFIVPIVYKTADEYIISLFLAMLVLLPSRKLKASLGVLVLSVYLVSSALLSLSFGNVIYQKRNFFGINQVINMTGTPWMVLVHGFTFHGGDAHQSNKSPTPESNETSLPELALNGYYMNLEPTFRKIRESKQASLNVMIAGLGVGHMACFAESKDHFTFVELDPDIIYIAKQKEWFSYLNRCSPKGGVIQGDGRQVIADYPKTDLDLVVMDVFHSEGVPNHMLTLEAMKLYASKMQQPNILLHITNSYYNLKPMLSAMAQHFGWQSVYYQSNDHDTNAMVSSSEWVLLTSSKDIATQVASIPHWYPLSSQQNTQLWTDQYSNLLKPIWHKLKENYSML